jgi:hypothetical protein
MIEVITSFDKKYYNLIGKESVDSWLKFWPADMVLTCYVEEFTLPEHPRLKQISFNQLSLSYFEFQQSQENDRVKLFAKKAYSVIHAMENSTADRIIWMDADVISEKKLSLDFLKGLCPDNTLTTFMGVWHHKIRGDISSELMFSVETGFFILNTKHPLFKDFANRYREYYDKHITINLRRFYDGEVFGAVTKEFKDKSIMNDLCSAFPKPYKTPIRHTILGEFLSHYKSKGLKDSFVGQRQ